MSKHFTISLTDEAAEVLNNRRENDPNFNFSGFIQEALDEDMMSLTEEDAKRKIKEAEIIIEEELKKIDHITEMLPTIKANEKINQSKKIKSMSEAVDTLKAAIERGSNELEIIKYARVHEKMTGIDYKELIREAQK